MRDQVSMEEEAVTAQACKVVVDRAGGAAEDSSDLAVGGAGDGVLVNFDEELGSFEPVGCGKGLRGEGPTAGSAAESLDGVRWFESGEGAELLEGPGVGLGVMESAGWVGAVGRGRRAWRFGLDSHEVGSGKT